MKTNITALALAAFVAAAAFTQPAAAATGQDQMWHGYPLSQWYSSPTGVPPGGR
jgi:hypothetical protein